MERPTDFNTFSPYEAMNYDPNLSDMYKDPMFNPMMQYEQAYLYYRSLCMQLDYKIKCKEYENLCANNPPNTRNEKRNEQPRI